jgi:hypothetical protein
MRSIMLERIKHRIESITREVEELHPLLQELFQKHPGISHVEYTHGPNEMGADFVLTSTHEILGTTEHIGIIAKRGKIQQKLDKGSQSVDDIARQIKECISVPRKTDNGKREVRLSEVWVVCTGAISNGAKTRIHADYPGTNVHFIDINQLSGMVDKYVPYFGSTVPLPVSTYLSDAKARSGELDKSFDLLQLEGEPIYIEQDIEGVLQTRG